MKGLSKRLIGMILSACMIISLCPDTVFAETLDNQDQINTIIDDFIEDESTAYDENDISNETFIKENVEDNVSTDTAAVSPNEDEEILVEGGANCDDSINDTEGLASAYNYESVVSDDIYADLYSVDTSVDIHNDVSSNDSNRYTVLVLDKSGDKRFLWNGSLIYTASTVFDQAKIASKAFLDGCRNSSNNYVAVVSVEKTASIVSEFTNDYDFIQEKIDSLQEGTEQSSGTGYTNMSEAMDKANSLLMKIDESNAKKNVVLLTSGHTNSGSYTYSGHYDYSTVGSDWYNIESGIRLFAYANSAYNSAENLKSNNCNIYVIGLFQIFDGMPEKGKEVCELFRLCAYEWASKASMFYAVNDPSKLKFVFEDVSSDITGYGTKFKFAGMTTDEEYDTEAKYYYDDNYFFDKPAIEYNNSLATMTLCLELSSWPSHENKRKWYEEKWSTTDAAFWNDSLVNIKKLLLGSPYEEEKKNGYAGIGFSEFKANSDWSKKPGRNTVGVCAARKQIKNPEDNKSYTLIALVVRGGGYESEWAGNFNVGNSGDHEGFDTARKEVLRFLKDDYLSTLKPNESKNIKIWLTGYSRAGATANLVAGEIDRGNFALNGIDFNPKEDLYCYTFEAPMGVNLYNMTTDELDGAGNFANIHNVRNVNDFVTLVAPSKWGFTKYSYNNDHVLPSHADAQWKTKYDSMIDQFDKIDQNTDVNQRFTSRDWYNVKEGVIEVDYENLKIGYIPTSLGYVDVKTVYTDTFIRDMMDFLAEDAIGSRSFYNTNLEDSVETLADVFLGSGKENIKDLLIDEFLNIKNISYIVAPIFSINPLLSEDAKIEKMNERLEEKIDEIFENSKEMQEILKDNNYLIDVNRLKFAINVVFARVYYKVAVDHFAHKDNSLDNILSFVQLLTKDIVIDDELLDKGIGKKKAGSLANAHYPEVCLAWVRSEDPKYNYNISEEDVSENPTSLRIVHINCPVDVSVLNEYGENIITIQNNSVVLDTENRATINRNGEKLLYLPNNGKYNVNIKATDNGEVFYSVNEYDLSEGKVTKLINFDGVSVSKGNQLQAIIPNIEEQTNNSEEEVPVSYQLVSNGADVPSISLSDNSIKQYSVNIVQEGNGGEAVGAGSYYAGNFVQVEATPFENAQFNGWYDGETLVSMDNIYRFSATQDITLTAKFSDIVLHKLTFVASEGGSILNIDDYYGKDMPIAIEAAPLDGYMFKRWVSEDSGRFKDENSMSTSFLMPEKDTVVTAEFEKAIPIESIEISKKNILLYIGDKERIETTIKPYNVTDPSLKYISGDENIATVDVSGYVEGKSEGETTITVLSSDGNVSAVCNVKVKIPLTATGMDPIVKPTSSNTVYLVVGKTCDLGKGSWSLTGKNSSKMISVNKKSGVVKAKKAMGTSYAILNNAETGKSYHVYVVNPSLKYDGAKKNSISSYIGQSEVIRVNGITSAYSSYYPVAWISSNEQVAKVESMGGFNANVICVGKGNANIYAYIEGKQYKATIKVADGVKTSIPKSINGSGGIYAFTLNPLQNVSIKYNNFDLKTATWKSSDIEMEGISKSAITDGIVQIDKNNGKITAVGEGTSEIQVTDRSGRNFKMNISVMPISSNPLIYMLKGASIAIKAPKLNLKKSTFDVDNDNILSVKSGKITGLNISEDGVHSGVANVTCIFKPFDYSKGLSYKIKVYVQAPALETSDMLLEAGGSNIKNFNRKLSLSQGDVFDLSDQYRGISQTVLWKSSNPNIAFIDEYGNIRANSNGKSGKTTLTATVNGIKFKVDVNVK